MNIINIYTTNFKDQIPAQKILAKITLLEKKINAQKNAVIMKKIM